MDDFTIDQSRVKTLASILRGLDYHPDIFEDITPFDCDDYLAMHFIFFLTAIDHNTHGKERYESVIEGETVHGSELMYSLARDAAINDPGLFTAESLREISEQGVKDLFTTADGKAPVGIGERAMLLRDAAKVLCQTYGCDLRNLFRKGDGFLRRPNGGGILHLLKEFKAYEDPLEKKCFLLIKVLRRKGLVRIKDEENLCVPVDHVLFTVALRSGIVIAEKEAREAILRKDCLSAALLEKLRLATLEAYKDVAACSGIPEDIFDDLLWAYGRECLRYSPPLSDQDIERIRIPLDDCIGNKGAIKNFLQIISGLDPEAPESGKFYPAPVFPPTWYF